MKQTNVCPRCGGELQFIEVTDKYKCTYCNSYFEEEKVINIQAELNKVFDEIKQEKIAHLRQRLYEAINEKYQSKDKIVSISREIRNYLPDDTMATFFEKLNTNINDINDYLNNIDINENYYLLDLIIENMIKSMEIGNILTLNNFIDNAYKNNDLSLYNKYTSLLSEEAEKLENGIYELNIPRDVFIAYSSKDMKYVEELVKALDENGITSFVAMKNLRHGKGAVENYDKALETAIDNSKIFLFISSNNSRNFQCDAYRKELPYIKRKDIDIAPAEYKHNYSKIPLKYKKPRIQYLLTKPKGTPIDKVVDEIFDGYEWRYDIDSVIENIINILMNNNIEEPIQEEPKENKQDDLKKIMEEILKAQQADKKQQEDSETEKLRKEKEEFKRQQEELKRLQDELKRQKEELDSKAKANKESSNTSTSKEAVKEEPKKEVKSKQKNVFKREGKIITFGSYYKNDDKTLEPLKWDILEEKDGKVLIITHDIIDVKAFDINKSNDYEKSSIRQWLNNDFYNEAFNEEDKKKIQLTLVDNSPQSTIEIPNKFACSNTNDNIFLLSYKEATTYYKNDGDRKAKGTLYSREKNKWLLRSRAPYSYGSGRASIVEEDGIIRDTACELSCGIRPVCWIDLKNVKIVKESPSAPILRESIKEESKKSIESKDESDFNNNDSKKIELDKDKLKSSVNIIREENTITFGSYYNRYEKTKEPLKWDILEEKDGKALIITHEIIDVKSYNSIYKEWKYEKSEVRQWLNNEFLKTAFSEDERDIIQLTLVDNSTKPTKDIFYETPYENTNDKIFLLSYKEATTYYKNDTERKAKGSLHAKKQGLEDSGGYSTWKLRTHAYNHDFYFKYYFVGEDGVIKNTSLGSYEGVRPSCWINLKFAKVIKKSSSKKIIEPQNNKSIVIRDENTITFGSYYDIDNKTKEPLKWDILKEKDGKALIITHDIIDAKPFHKKSNNYEKSEIRKWLNNDFYNIAFDEKEREKIQLTNVDNSIDSTGFTDNKLCKDTIDKLFLLSRNEVNTYFKSENEKIAEPTVYAFKLSSFAKDWWLRSSYPSKNIVLVITDNGHIIVSNVKWDQGVRPACWIKLK